MLNDETTEPPFKKRKMDEKNVLLNNAEKKVGYNRCRKPINTTENCKTTSLRQVSKVVVDAFNARIAINPILTTNDRLCYKCERKVRELCESSQESSSQSKFLFE